MQHVFKKEFLKTNKSLTEADEANLSEIFPEYPEHGRTSCL